MAMLDNLFYRFNFSLFGITFTAHRHLSLSHLNDSEVPVKLMAIHGYPGYRDRISHDVTAAIYESVPD